MSEQFSIKTKTEQGGFMIDQPRAKAFMIGALAYFKPSANVDLMAVVNELQRNDPDTPLTLSSARFEASKVCLYRDVVALSEMMLEAREDVMALAHKNDFSSPKGDLKLFFRKNIEHAAGHIAVTGMVQPQDPYLLSMAYEGLVSAAYRERGFGRPGTPEPVHPLVDGGSPGDLVVLIHAVEEEIAAFLLEAAHDSVQIKAA